MVKQVLMFGFAAVVAGTAVAASASPDKVLVCHRDVDDDDPTYTSIVIEVSENAVPRHLANHGDQLTFEPVGTTECIIESD